MILFIHKISEKISITKLTEQSNYEVWSLRVQSLLVKRSLNNAIEDEASLKTEDGLLLQIQHSKTALKAWKMLKNLYSPKGFSSKFLICKKLFETILSKYSSIEEYLNKVKQLTNQLNAKGFIFNYLVILIYFNLIYPSSF